MKICIVHGSPRKGNTYRATEILKKVLKENREIEFTEFFLPKDMPHFCMGCFSCIIKGEEKCPHYQYTQPIVDALRNADGIVLTSPVESGGMKSFLDHLAYIFMSHRPMEEMFSKVAMVISTTAGAGTGHVMKTLSRNLRYWGVKRIYKCGFTLYAKEWEDMKMEKQQKFEKRLYKKGTKFYRKLEKRERLSPRIFTRVMFNIMRNMVSGFEDGHLDKVYWEEKGWISGEDRPY